MFATLFRWLGRTERPAARLKTKHSVVPTLEALEERWVPSTTNTQSLVGNVSTVVNNTPAIATSNAPTPTQQTTATFTSFTTGGSQTQSVAQFNPNLGQLASVQITLNGTLTSNVKIENYDAAPSTVNAQVNGDLSLQGPDGSTLLSVAPTISENSTQLAANNGSVDFGDQSASAQNPITLTNNLSAWEGDGNVSLTESAQSSSTVSGSGNEQVNICSDGSGTVTVTYNYTPKPQSPPPAPPPSPLLRPRRLLRRLAWRRRPHRRLAWRTPPAPPPVSPPPSPRADWSCGHRGTCLPGPQPDRSLRHERSGSAQRDRNADRRNAHGTTAYGDDQNRFLRRLQFHELAGRRLLADRSADPHAIHRGSGDAGHLRRRRVQRGFAPCSAAGRRRGQLRFRSGNAALAERQLPSARCSTACSAARTAARTAARAGAGAASSSGPTAVPQ